MIGAILTSCAKKQTYIEALLCNRPVTNLLPYCKAGRPNPSSSCSHDAFCSATLLSYASSPIQVLLHQSRHDNVVCSPTAACWSNDEQGCQAHQKRLSQQGRRMRLGAKHDRVDVAIRVIHQKFPVPSMPMSIESIFTMCINMTKWCTDYSKIERWNGE